MRKLEIRCPSCLNIGNIEVEENLITKSARGVTAVNVAEYLVCDHSFVAYIDKNFDIRDCFITDFTVELPQIQVEQEKGWFEGPDSEGIDIYLLIINMNALELVYIIKGLLLKMNVLYINNLEIIHNHLTALIEYAFYNTFEYDFSVISHLEYEKNKKQYKNYIVIEKKEIIFDRKKQMNFNKIKVESTIIEKFLAETHPRSTLIILKNEIWKTYKICNYIQNYLDSYDREKKLGKKELLDKLNEKYKIKVQLDYLEFILEILKKYFGYDLSKLSDYFLPRLGL